MKLRPKMLAIVSLTFALVLSHTLSAAPPTQDSKLAKHIPKFSLKNNKIYDNDKRIANISLAPEAGYTRVLYLSKVRFSPTSKYEISEWGLMHREGPFTKVTMNVDDSNPQALKMKLACMRKGGAFHIRAEVLLTYDPELNSYVYEVSMEREFDTADSYKLKADSWESFRRCRRFSSTRTDSCYLNLNCDQGTKHFVYEDRDGGLSKVPRNCLVAPDKYNLRPKKGGALTGFTGRSERALMIELVGETATNSDVHLCNAGFDVWFCWIMQPGRTKARARFKIFSYDKKSVDEYFKNATVPSFTDKEYAALSLPAYHTSSHPLSDFESEVSLKKPNRHAFWVPCGDVITGMEWSRKVGHSGTGSLKTQTDTPAECSWNIPRGGGMARSVRMPAGDPPAAIVSVWIKTENLVGEGAYFIAGFRLSRKWLRVESAKLTGTNDWTKLSVKIPPTKKKAKWVPLKIELVHKGKGTSYFDDVDYKFVDK